MQPEEQARIMRYFIEEAKDHLNTIEQGLLNLQSTIEDSEMINEVFRAAHSVKGGAAMLGIDSLRKTAHRLEDCFKILKEEPITVDKKLESLFLKVFDTMSEILEELDGPYGLTEEIERQKIAEVEPILVELNDYLNFLMKKPVTHNKNRDNTDLKLPVEQTTIAPVISPERKTKTSATVAEETAAESSALQLIFRSDVTQKMREMLQIFKQEDSADSRSQLQEIGHSLTLYGEQFEINQWVTLIEAVNKVTANLDITYRIIAPVVIQEIKQAQGLVLSGKWAEITISEELKQLLPAEADIEEEEIENLDFIDVLNLENSDLGKSIQTNNMDMAMDSNWISENPETLNSKEFNFSIMSSENNIATDRDETESILSTSGEQIIPEVEMDVLNSLANLFEGESDDLGERKRTEEENILDLDDNRSPMLNIIDELDNSESNNDFADLLFTTDTSSQKSDKDSREEDEIINLFDDHLASEENHNQESLDNLELLDNFDDLVSQSSEDMVEFATLSTESDPFNPKNENESFNWEELETNQSDDVSINSEPLNQLFSDGVENDLLFADIAEKNLDISKKSAIKTDSSETNDILAEISSDADFNASNLFSNNEEIASLETGEILVDESDDFSDLLTIDASDSRKADKTNTLWTAELAENNINNNEENYLDLDSENNWLDNSNLDILGDEDNFGIDNITNEAEEISFAAEINLDLEDDLEDSLLQITETVATVETVEITETESFSWLDMSEEELQLETENSSLETSDRIENIESLFSDLPEQEETAAGENWLDLNLDEIPDEISEEIPREDNLSDLFAWETTAENNIEQNNSLFNDTELLFNEEAIENTDNNDLFDRDLWNNIEAIEENPSISQPILSTPSETEMLSLEWGEDLFSLDSAEENQSIDNTSAEDFNFEFDPETGIDSQEDFADIFANESTQATETDETEINWIDTELNLDLTEDLGESFSENIWDFPDEKTTLEKPENQLDDVMFNDMDWLSNSSSDLAIDSQLTLEELLSDEEIKIPETTSGNGKVNVTEADADVFLELEAILNKQPNTTDVFTELDSLLGVTAAPVIKQSIPENRNNITAAKTVQQEADDDEWKDMEDMLDRGTDKSIKTTGPRPQAPRPVRQSEQTMKVPVKQLDSLSNLVGELVVNRNSLEQDQERLRQSLDNLLYQVSQLSDVSQRMQDLYERSLLEISLLASRKNYRLNSRADRDSDRSSSSSNHDSTWDVLEMDRFTPFHTLSQEIIELMVRVRESAADIEFLVDEADQVTRQLRQVTTQLQEGLTRSRMEPFSQIVNKLERGVRVVADNNKKEAELRIEGKDTLIDKTILESLSDPLTHLLNNAVAHGIETPSERIAKGKNAKGRITISVFHQGNQTVISFADDGAGIDVDRVKAKALEKKMITPEQARTMTRLDAYELLFEPSFSTRDEADGTAGRGVGMNVVKENVHKIRGSITTDSITGKGTTFTIRLPLTLSISKALYCLSDKSRIAFPMDGVEDMMDVPLHRIKNNSEGQKCVPWRDQLLPFRPLKELLTYNRSRSRTGDYGTASGDEEMISIVILRSAGTYLAIEVDKVLGEQEIVIKQLEGPVPKPVGIAGATVMGDGRIVPIADVLELIDLALGRIRRDQGTMWDQNAGQVPEPIEDIKNDPTVLIVDDSITVRELLSMTFNKAGYRVEQARDGQEAWEKLRSGLPCDIVFCDIEMPRMDGLELLSRMQKDSHLSELPIAMLTSRGADKHRQMAIQMGASGYFTKPYLEEALLDAAMRMLKGEVLVGSGSGN